MLYSLALHVPTHSLATAGFNGEIQVWDSDSGEEIRRFIAAPGFQSPVQAARSKRRANE
jgi:hypothetical protein